MYSHTKRLVLCLLTVVGLLSAVDLVRDGKPVSSIVLSARPTRSARFAASELQYHLRLLTGATLPIVHGARPGSGNVILVGHLGNHMAKPFSFQEYLIQSDGKELILAGCDDPDLGIFDYGKEQTFPGFWGKQGTVYAVYDFLELVGIRWYLPTDLGIAFTPVRNLSVPRMVRRRKPTMELRNMFFLSVPADLCGDTIESPDPGSLPGRELRLWYLRRRHGGREVIINHSMYTFYNRYWPAKKDWFAKGYGNGKPAQLCYTNPEVIERVAQDARDFFDGKLRSASEVLSNVPPSYRSDVFPVFPMDNRSFCKCPACAQFMATHTNDYGKQGHFSCGVSSEYLFHFVNEVAKRVKRTHPDKFIGAGAYAGFAYPPTSFRLENNVVVMMCLHTRFVHNKSITENDDRILQAWQKAYPNMKKYVWMYWCFPTQQAVQQQFRIFPEFFAGKIGGIFRKYRRAGIEGMFHEPSYLPHSRYSVLFDQLEGHINWSLAWDESRDSQQLYDDFFRLYYGPAEKPMKEWYQLAEGIVTAPAKHSHQTDEIAWRQLGTTENMKKLGACMDAAMAMKLPQPYLDRVRLFHRGVWNYMCKGKQRGDQLDALRTPSMQQAKVPFITVKEAGNPRTVNWKRAHQLRLYGGLRAEKMQRDLMVNIAHDGQWLYIRALERKVDPATLKANDLVWLNDEWEFFFGAGRRLPYRQVGIDAAGKVSAVLHEGTVTENWDFPGNVVRTSGKDWWQVAFAIRLRDLSVRGFKPGDMLYGNLIRSRQKALGVWIPTFTGYHAPGRFGEWYLAPKPNVP